MKNEFNTLNHPLTWIFRAASHVAVLRALLDSKEGMSGRAVAREAGINHQTCVIAIRALEELGLLQRRGSGQSQLIRLNRANHFIENLISPLLKKERDFLKEIEHEIKAQFEEKASAITIFGSSARLESKPGSDVDLFIVAKEREKSHVTEAMTAFSPLFKEKFGFRLSPFVLTKKEALQRKKTGDPLLKNILNQGKDLLPQRLQEVLNDTALKPRFSPKK